MPRRAPFVIVLDTRTDRLRTVLHEPEGRRNGPVIEVGSLPLFELGEVLLLHGFEPQGALTLPDQRLTGTAQILAEIRAQPALVDSWRRKARVLNGYRTWSGDVWRDTPQRRPHDPWDRSLLAAGAQPFQDFVDAIEGEAGVRIETT